MPEPTAPSTDPAATTEPATTPTEPPATGATVTDTENEGKGSEKAVLADLARERKERQRLTKELQTLREQSMSEAEKAVAEAEKRGAATVTATFGQRLVRSDFTVAAARINPDFDVAAVLDDLNLAKFVGDDGEPDTEAIKKAVERLVPPAGGPRPPSFDGGARTSPPASAGMNDLIRKAVGRG